jgi:hypothetical protein
VSDSWDQVWVVFQESVGRLHHAAEPEGRGFVVRLDRYANETFPFRAHASYSPASAPGDEELVLSVDFKRVGRLSKVTSTSHEVTGCSWRRNHSGSRLPEAADPFPRRSTSLRWHSSGLLRRTPISWLASCTVECESNALKLAAASAMPPYIGWVVR